MRIVLAGDSPTTAALQALCLAAGHAVVAFKPQRTPAGMIVIPDAAEIPAADVVLEALDHSRDLKWDVWRAIIQRVETQPLLLTSTLAASVAEAAYRTSRSDQVVGFGLLPPVQTGDIVELARGLQTSRATFDRATAFWQDLGLVPAEVADGPGLVRARVVCCLINEAVSALADGVATAADIDRAMKLGANYPYGPLEWADMIGLDTVLGVMEGLQAEWGEDRYRPHPLLRRYVLAGKVGRRAGEGFYPYPAAEVARPSEKA